MDGPSVGKGDEGLREGLAYCFLPLPVHTGLPLMVNGVFELSSNRRDIWQSGVDMTGDGRTRAQWNLTLMTDRLWPSAYLSSPWNHLTDSVFAMCRMEPLLCMADIDPHNNQTGAIGTSSYWVPCYNAILLPEDGGLSSNDVEHL
eukprot:gene6432-8541_t